MIASSVYILNDILDLNSDRLHIRKKNRPIASGNLQINEGIFTALFLILLGFLLSYYQSFETFFIIIIYYLLTLLYSVVLKKIIVMDIITLAALYTIRIVIGGISTGIDLSIWLLVFSLFIFLSLAAIKRQAELILNQKNNIIKNNMGRGYSLGDLPFVSKIASISGYLSVLVMLLYINSPEIISLYSSPWVLWVVCLIMLYWINYMISITKRGQMDDDPLLFAIKDKASYISLSLISILLLIGVIL